MSEKIPRTYRKIEERDDGWSAWISPNPAKPYRMACCDCGLVHDLEFQAVEELSQPNKKGWWKSGPLAVPYRVLLRARRNEAESQKLRARDAAAAPPTATDEGVTG